MSQSNYEFARKLMDAKFENSSMNEEKTNTSRDTVFAIVLAIVLLGLIGMTAKRTFENYSQPASTFDWSHRGHSDFHCGVYYPSLAFRKQVNPYSIDVMETYPVPAPSRLNPPISFITHLPFSYLELHTADLIFFVYNTSLLLLLAYFTTVVTRGSFRWLPWLGVSCILLISRPGHITLFTGYMTLELVLGTLFALHFAKHRPWVSALGILIASGKPTFVLPLIVLMLARKNYRATARGVVLCVIFGVGGLAWLASETGMSNVVAGIQESQSVFHADESEFPINTWTRVDLLGMFAKTIDWVPGDSVYLAGMLLLLIVPCILINQTTDREQDSGITGLTGCLALITILIAIYHHSYDCLLVVVPMFGFAFYPTKVVPELPRRTKLFLAFLLSVPLLNYLSTQTARNILGFDQYDLIWQSITMINGICLVVALTILMAVAFHHAVANTIRRDFGK